MIPNRFVVLWDDTPIAIVSKFPIAPYAKRTNEPSEIYWFDTKINAEKFINTQPLTNYMKIVEIQFRILDKK